MSTFGHFIKEEREKRGWTQTQLGALIGINSTAISRIENESKVISPHKVRVLSDVFGINNQTVIEHYYADKFAREAYINQCSDNVFTVARRTLNYYKSINTKQGRLEL